MDAISGGTFGLYLTTYLWLFIGVRWIITFLHVGNNPLLPFIVIAGVLMENFIFVGSSVIFEPGLHFTSEMSITIGVQVFWAIFTGPMFLMLFKYSFGKWDKRVKAIFTREVGR
jgi:rod shape-determining protein MreD